MRYEHIELDISTVTCAKLLEAVNELIRQEHIALALHAKFECRTVDELTDLRNELEARLQRRDADPHCPRNKS